MKRIIAASDRSPKPVDIYVGTRITTARKLSKLSQVTLAHEVGLTFQQIQKYENGTNRVSASTLYDLARVLKVPITYFYLGYSSADEDQCDEEKGVALRRVLTTPQGVELAEAFPLIGSAECRDKILDLVRVMSRPSDQVVDNQI